MTTSELLGYQVYNQPLDACVDEIVRVLDQPQARAWLACLNPHSYATALDDPAFATALRKADWLVADGSGIVLASRILRLGIHSRVSGPDVFTRLHARVAPRGARVFFLGSSPATLARITERLSREHPLLRVAGTYSPPFRASFTDEENADMIAAVNRARPDILWVAMTAPKQEKWLAQHRQALDVPFAGAVGAVFDFYAGTVPRSSPVFQRLGLEWLPRLLREPRRLWARTFVSAPRFLYDVLRARLSRR